MVEYVLDMENYIFTLCCSIKDALYKDPNLLDQLKANPAYGTVPTSTVKVEKGDEEYETWQHVMLHAKGFEQQISHCNIFFFCS